MVVLRSIELFLNGTDENIHNGRFQYIDFPEPNHEYDDEDDLLAEVLEEELEDSHESEPEPEPENEPIPEPEYDEPIPENYHDLMEKMEQGIDFLVEDLLYEFRLSDDELRSTLTHILNNTYPPECSDELREIIDDAIERIEYHHLDINEVVDYALYNLNLRRRYPRQFYA